MVCVAIAWIAAGCTARSLDYLQSGASTGAGGAGGLGGAGGNVSSGGMGGGDITTLCPTPGWCRLPGTRLIDECEKYKNEPQVDADKCGQLYYQNSGVVDPTSLSLYLFGAGTNASTSYRGNEVYRVRIADGVMERVTVPDGFFSMNGECYVTDPTTGLEVDTRPVPRQTFDGLVALPAMAPDIVPTRMVAFGGSVHCTEDSDQVWAFDFASAQWAEIPTMPDPLGPQQGKPAGLSVKVDHLPGDPDVYVATNGGLWSYGIDTSTFEYLRSIAATLNQVARLAPASGGSPKRMVLIGGSDYDLYELTFPDYPRLCPDENNPICNFDGCAELLNATAPGFEYHPRLDLFVGWSGVSSAIYLLDPLTGWCSAVDASAAGTPPSVAADSGTRGHFRYVEPLDLFVASFDWADDAYLFRLPPDDELPTPPRP